MTSATRKKSPKSARTQLDEAPEALSRHLAFLSELSATALRSETFFRFLVKSLATTLDVQIAFVAEQLPNDTAALLAVWTGTGFAKPFRFNLRDTPSQAAIDQGYLFQGTQAQQRFANDPLLEVIGAQSVRARALRDSDGKPLGVLALLDSKPMQDDRSAEELLRLSAVRAAAELVQSRRDESLLRIARAAEQSTEQILVTDADGTIEFVNAAFETATGLTRGQLLGQPAASLRSAAPEDKFFDRIEEVMESHRPFRGRIHTQASPGHEAYQDARVIPMRDGASAPSGFLAFRHDMSELAEAQTRLSQSQRLEAIGALTSGIAHDFNNVLAAILALAHVALLDTRKKSRAHAPLTELVDAAKRATELVRQILEFSRSQHGAAHPIQAKVVVSEALRFLRASVPATIEIHQQIDSDSFVISDPSGLHRILINLCTNAALAMQGQLGTLRIELNDYEVDDAFQARHPEAEVQGYVHLGVSDTGCGIPPELLEKVFEPFFTTRSSEQGTGMGLAVVKGIVEKCAGLIEVHSEKGSGTRFDVYLPRVQGRAAVEAEETPLVEGSARIMFVDDQPRFGQTAARILGQMGYSVTPYESSLEALQALRNSPRAFDLVISDLIMPKMTGDALAGEIKKLREDLPVILYTGYADGLSLEEAKAAGADDLLIKPVDWGRLSKVMQLHLSRENEGSAQVGPEFRPTRSPNDFAQGADGLDRNRPSEAIVDEAVNR